MNETNPLSEILNGVAIPFAYKLGYVLNSYREPSFRSIEANLGLTRPEILSLIFLYYRDGISAADICDFSGHLKNNISRAATALERKGLIRRATDTSDQRRQLIYMTPAGKKMHSRFMPGLVARESDMLSCLTDEDRDNMHAILIKLCAHAPSWNSTQHV
jgi:DNA-binding MarR family transcriptional regulator